MNNHRFNDFTLTNESDVIAVTNKGCLVVGKDLDGDDKELEYIETKHS
jgi:hypothetical protein